MPLITQSDLQSILHYDPDTGIWTWRARLSTRIQIGDEAGTISYGHRRIVIDGLNFKAHDLAFIYMTGSEPKGFVVHLDNNKLNNAWANLKDMTFKEAHLHKVNTNPNHGVYYHRPSKKWQARIWEAGYSRHLGSWPSRDEARAAMRNYLTQPD